MRGQNVFAEFANLLDPDFKRPKNQGDFYNSPLRLFGYPHDQEGQGYQIPPEWMHIKSNKTYEKARVSLNEIMFSLLRDSTEFIRLKRCIAILFFSEASLRIYNRETLLPDFFKGIDHYASHFGKDSHRPERLTYGWLLHAALAVVWAAHKRLSPDPVPPKNSGVESDVFESCSLNKEDLLAAYRELYSKSHNKISPFLDDNLSAYLNNGSAYPEYRYSIFRAPGINKSLPKEIVLGFSIVPLNTLFHKVKRGNNLDFSRPGKNFTFCKEHPSYQPLWHTLLLIDLLNLLPMPLDRQLSNFLPKMNMNTLNNEPVGALDKLTTTDLYAEPIAAKMLYDGFDRGLGARRLLAAPVTKPDKGLLRADSDSGIGLSEWRAPEGRSPFATWNITLDIAESYLEDDLWLHFGAFYYHDGKRTQIPCELIRETEQGNRVAFEIGLDRTVIEYLDFKPDEVRRRAGFSCSDDGEAWLLLVFKQ